MPIKSKFCCDNQKGDFSHSSGLPCVSDVHSPIHVGSCQNESLENKCFD